MSGSDPKRNISWYMNDKTRVMRKIQIDQDFIVLLETDPGLLLNENIFRIRFDGDIVWQISVTRYIYDESPYVEVNLNGDILWAFNSDSSRVDIDVESGRILRKVHVR